MSIISFFGSKASNAFQTFINPIIPKTGVKTYTEPFSGSMASFCDGDLNFENVIYNDKNIHQTNLMYCCSKPIEFLPYIYSFRDTILHTDETEPLKKWDFYKAVFHKYRNDFLKDRNYEIGNFEKAAIYAFLHTSAHNNIVANGGFNGYKKNDDKLKLEVLINKLVKNTYTDKLNTISKFLCKDFEELIKEYDAEDTYLYIDPPYASPTNEKNDDAKRLGYYGSKDDSIFGINSHKRLLELLKTTKSRWSLSYYYFPLLEEMLPKDKYIWLEKEVTRTSAQGGNNSESKTKAEKGKELLVLNYDPITGIKL